MPEASIRCPSCSTLLKVQVIHGGFSDLTAFTCPKDSTVTTVASWDKTIDEILEGFPPTPITDDQWRKLEARLKPCPCGARFRHDVLPKCPSCGRDLRVSLGPSEFIVVGRMIDGARESPWVESLM